MYFLTCAAQSQNEGNEVWKQGNANASKDLVLNFIQGCNLNELPEIRNKHKTTVIENVYSKCERGLQLDTVSFVILR